ncbi:hypothetical protein N8766_04700 [bacterium]|nr:hypothetical protein [Verrucomicrobiota bacterium]MDA7633389.1 hypothetical protein [bacterium]MDA7644923.1 hypothetical protein [bacterium]
MENSGESIALTRHGKVVAEIVPARNRVPKRGCLKSIKFYIADDFDQAAAGFEDFFREGENSENKTNFQQPKGRKLRK